MRAERLIGSDGRSESLWPKLVCIPVTFDIIGLINSIVVLINDHVSSDHGHIIWCRSGTHLIVYAARQEATVWLRKVIGHMQPETHQPQQWFEAWAWQLVKAVSWGKEYVEWAAAGLEEDRLGVAMEAR